MATEVCCFPLAALFLHLSIQANIFADGNLWCGRRQENTSQKVMFSKAARMRPSSCVKCRGHVRCWTNAFQRRRSFSRTDCENFWAPPPLIFFDTIQHGASSLAGQSVTVQLTASAGDKAYIYNIQYITMTIYMLVLWCKIQNLNGCQQKKNNNHWLVAIWRR